MASTACNLGLAQAGHCLVGKCLKNSKLCGSLQMRGSPACAKPLHVARKSATAQCKVRVEYAEND